MYYKNKDMTLYYEKYGNKGQPLLILPGWGDTRGTFDYLISLLKEKYTIYIFDYPGFGKSSFPSKDLTIYDYAFYWKDFLQEKKIEDSIIIAHSFGGRIATLLSSYYQIPIQKLIFLDTAGIKPRKTIRKWFKQTTYKVLKKLTCIFPKRRKVFFQQWLFKRFSSPDYQALSPNMMKSFRSIINEDLTKYFKDISVETLLIWGEKDEDTPLSDGKKMEKEIPNSALVILPQAGHFCYLTYPQLVFRIICSFLDEKKPKSS